MANLFNTESILSHTGLFWQYPVITEKTFYHQNKNDISYIGLPWATIIDKRININDIIQVILPKLSKNVKYYTCCQHILFRKLIPIFKFLNICTVYSCHKTISEDKIQGVTIKPCPLYAVNILDNTRNTSISNVDYVNIPRKYLYSFQGAYVKGVYMTDVRKRIFDMQHPPNCKISNIGNWYFEKIVYSNMQNKNENLNEDSNYMSRCEDYNQLLLNSRYSLCPSGSGPNSIRFWESLAVGSIPILLSDTLELPNNDDWDNAIIRVPEIDLSEIPCILQNISFSRESEMRKKCIQLFEYYKDNYKNIILKYN